MPAEPLAPPRPGPRICVGGCGHLIEPEFVPAAMFQGRAVGGTNDWSFQDTCDPCRERLDGLETSQDVQGKIKKYLAEAGLSPRHEDMALDKLDGAAFEVLRDSISGFMLGRLNLFIHGKPGTGKTYPAVALLKKYIERHCVSGRFEIVVELVDELRAAIREKKSEALVNAITAGGALVLDDLGVERPTPYVTERLYLIIDRWHRNKKSGLIITSNRTLDEISQSLDDRITSRIFDICRIIEVKGPDRRLAKK